MTDLDRLTAALSDRYTIEHELGAGGMAYQRGGGAAGQRWQYLASRPLMADCHALAAPRTPYTAL